MLPVSNWEKYLSYTLFCLLTPFLVVFCSWCFDSLLTLLPFGGFNHYIRHLGFVNVMQDLVVELGAAEVEGIDEFNELQSLKGLFGPAYTTSIILSIVFNVGFFMFGNLLFKTHKTGKTFAIMIGFSYVMSLFSQLFFLAKGSSLLVSHNVADLNLIKELTSGLVSFSNILYVFLTIGLFIGLFYKLKTQKY